MEKWIFEHLKTLNAYRSDYKARRVSCNSRGGDLPSLAESLGVKWL